MQPKLLSKLIISALIATLLALTAHIYLLKWTTPIINAMSQGHQFATPKTYSHTIVTWAYITAIEQMLVTAFVYYFVADLFKFKRKIIKIFIFSAILLELKGSLIRETFMNGLLAYNASLSHPFIYALLTQLDQYAAGFLLMTALVLFCPTKKYQGIQHV